MNGDSTRAFVQARMGSRRFPGKVLAPFRGEPIVLHVVRAAGAAVGANNVLVATTAEPSDDPLCAYLASVGIPFFRGSIDDVVERFQRCIDVNPCEWVLRLCADSPLLDPLELAAVVAARAEDIDLVSTTLAKSPTHGRNAELIRAAALTGLDPSELTAHDREHVTPFFYRHPERFRLRAVELPPSAWNESLTVDTVDDLVRLETLA